MRFCIDCIVTLSYWLAAFAFEGLKINSLSRRMRQSERTITAARVVSAYKEHGGTLLVEIDRILTRGIWYTPDDVTAVQRVELPEDLQRGPGSINAHTLFDYWCHTNWLNETSGTALLVVGRNNELEDLVRSDAIHVPFLRGKTDEPCDSHEGPPGAFSNGNHIGGPR